MSTGGVIIGQKPLPLEKDVMQVKKKVCPDDPYAIGLRLGAEAAEELSQPEILKNFKQWLEKENAYVFTINGFPYGNFHGQQVKEKVYQPDWTEPARLSYTITLFEILLFSWQREAREV